MINSFPMDRPGENKMDLETVFATLRGSVNAALEKMGDTGINAKGNEAAWDKTAEVASDALIQIYEESPEDFASAVDAVFSLLSDDEQFEALDEHDVGEITTQIMIQIMSAIKNHIPGIALEEVWEGWKVFSELDEIPLDSKDPREIVDTVVEILRHHTDLNNPDGLGNSIENINASLIANRDGKEVGAIWAEVLKKMVEGN